MPALIYPVLLACVLTQGAGAGWLLVIFNIAVVPTLDHAVRWRWPGWLPPPTWQRVCFAPAWFWIYALAQAAALIGALQLGTRQTLDVLGFMGLASGIGIMTGTGGITAAHELVHRRHRRERALGLGLLAMASYLHFRIQHVEGHHRFVGTPQDPVSAARGDRFPSYFARVLWQGPAQAWRLECVRRRARSLPVWAPGNRVLQYALLQLLIYGAIGIVFGGVGVALFLLQSLIAIHLLEAVNFVQHYGLRRAGAAGQREAVGEQHAWESADPISPLLVFNLSRHAVHHRCPAVPLQELPVSTRAPRLPYSFFLMVFLALIPPLWTRVMEPRLRQLLVDQDRKPPSTVSVVPVT